MSADKLNKNKDKFDETLRRALRLSSEPSPAEFTGRILRQIRQAEERRILARVVLQERLALAGCIALGAVIIVMAAVLPGVAGSFTERIEVFISKISQATEKVSAAWQFYTLFAGVFGLAMYNFVDLLVGDS